MKKTGSRVILAILVMIWWQGCRSVEKEQFSDTLSEASIKADLNFLASKELQGREAGTPGAAVASLFLAEKLASSGLQPMIAGSDSAYLKGYFQNFEISGVTVSRIQTYLSVRSARKKWIARPGRDFFYFFNSPASLDFSGEAVFAGYAIQAPEYKYDDLSSIDCRDKIVVAFYGEPLEGDSSLFFNGTHRTHYTTADWKSQRLAELGARALVLVPTPENAITNRKMLKRWSMRTNEKKFILSTDTSIPVIYLTPEFSWSLFGKSFETDFSEAQKKLRNHLYKKEGTLSWSQPVNPGIRWQLRIKLPELEKRTCRNVLGILPGRDNALQKEYILVGAHYDHEGVKDGKILRGADDNASGVVAGMNAALALAKMPQNMRPQRSILFAFWDAEESGTLGSRFFCNQLENFPGEIKTVFNMDMIGRDASFNFAALRQPMKDEDAENKVMLFYSAQAPELAILARQANADVGLHLLFDPNVFFTSGSDHVNFHMKQIPVVYYFTGFHTDYSSVADTPEKINTQKLTRISRHIASYALSLARTDQVPKFNPEILDAPEGDFRR